MLLDHYNSKFQDIIESLQYARTTGRMPHAYLLHGDSDALRRDFSLIIAQIASCPSVDNMGAPCGVCQVCSQLESGTYPELYTLMPSSKSRIIPIGKVPHPEPDTVRWFEDLFYLTSTSCSGMKIGIIYDADRMTLEAQNAFLKTLEEPPANTFFILASGNPSALLPTTRSRCQLLMILENKCVYDFTGATQLCEMLRDLYCNARGDFVKAETCAETLISLAGDLKKIAKNNMEKLWCSRIDQAGQLEDKFYKKRLEERLENAIKAECIRIRTYFLSALHSFFAEIYQLSCGVDKKHLANPELLEGINRDSLDEVDASAVLEKAEKLLADLRWSVNEELALRQFCMNIAIL